jgi:predicted HicB family RNase H-like nuclease
MTHKGYSASVELDAAEGVFNGRVTGLRDVIHFQGTSVAELQHAFVEAIDDYVDWCEELGQEPEKPYSGKLLLRLGSDLHRAVARQAARLGCTQNQFVLDAVENAIGLTQQDRTRPLGRLVFMQPVEAQYPTGFSTYAGAEPEGSWYELPGAGGRARIDMIGQAEQHAAQRN